MTLNEVCKKFKISKENLHLYERIGVVPRITRTAGGYWDFQAEDIMWLENMMLMREAGIRRTIIAEYVRLYMEGDRTIEERLKLLKEERIWIIEDGRRSESELEWLDQKIKRYELILKTGIISMRAEDLFHLCP